MRTAGSAWITGASGFVGRQLSGHLRRTGWQVATARLRHGEYTALPKAGDVVFHAGALAHRRGDALPAFMGANCELALDLYQQASDAGAAGFVFLSTAKVLGESSAGTEAALPIDAPRRPHGPYAESKAAAEERLLAAWRQRRLALAIVRPPLVYGPGVRANFRALLKAVALGLPLPLAAARAPRSLVSVANLVDALGMIGGALDAYQHGIWHVTDGQDIDVATLCHTLARHLGRKAKLWRLPPALLHVARRTRGLAALGASIHDPFLLDDSALRSSLAWTAPQSLDAALEETARWWITRRATQP